MSLLVNLKQLQEDNVELEGEASIGEVHFDFTDEVVRFAKPLTYRLTVQHLHDSLLLTGVLQLPVQCHCVRCLKPFEHVIMLRDWACHIPLAGEDSPAVIKDSVDLTPYIREDMVLALPTHPVCRDDCPGLEHKPTSDPFEGPNAADKTASPWDELNKLKLKS
ncbi:MAG TPA: hypothetical protein DCY13_21375 [Verrucomicrobiales bacterium]|nr:hypothetical protein [Verrucomicrobiales bacterium]